MLKELQLAKKLLTLATNEASSEHERMNAAKRALEVISKLEADGGVVMASTPKSRGSYPERPQPQRYRDPVDEIFSDAIRNATHRTRPGASYVPSGKGDTRVKAKAPGVCQICNKGFAKGEFMIFLKDERKFVHPDCYHDNTARTG